MTTTRRQAAATLLVLFSGGTAAAVMPSLAANLKPIPTLEEGELEFIGMTMVFSLRAFVKHCATYCPGIENALLAELQGVAQRMLAQRILAADGPHEAFPSDRPGD